MKKNLSVAFLWHMHQPVYQDTYDGVFFMPWVRLHAVKDYLDMLYKVDKFPKLRLNFNLSPTILVAFQKYAKGYDDLHSMLTVKPVEELTDQDKLFVLNYFFDANYNSMVRRYHGYDELYKKRKSKDEIKIDEFSLQEYSDIMFWFNLAWTDPIWIKKYPKLKELVKKDKNYTLEDRQYLIDVHRDIIRKIIPAYKKYQDKNKIEVLTNPLYHPILPLLLDVNVAKNSTTKYGLPNCTFNTKNDAEVQVKEAISLYEELFDKKLNGMWPSELSVSENMLKLFSKHGIKWTIADEGILSESIKDDFERDTKGNLLDPYHLSHMYRYKSGQDKDIGIFFRNSVMANLIGFEYPNYDSEHAASDLYERIKQIQDKLKSSPDSNHIVVIAMDGENSWENYANDGNKFLETIYSLITNDETLETVLLSDYFERQKQKKVLKSVSPGSWISRNFQLWIAEPTKNKAWEILMKARSDLLLIEQNLDDEDLKKALWKELYVAEGSDWFWWFGEPNDSGQDNLFDYLFRKHLQNIYEMANKPIPDYLKEPLITFSVAPTRFPKLQIEPNISGKGDAPEWGNAGCIDIPSGPLSNENQVLTRICYGIGEKDLYLKMDVNKYTTQTLLDNDDIYQIYIYVKNRTFKKSAKGKLRVVMHPEMLAPILKENFSHEIKFTFSKNKNFKAEVAYANKDGLWFLKLNNNIEYVIKNVLEIKVPLDDIDIQPGEVADFLIVDGVLGRTSAFYPRDMFLSVKRISTEK